MAKEATTEGVEQTTAALDLNAPEIQEAINKAVKDATTGLAKNRDDLLAEKKQLAERAKLLDDLGGEDGIKKLREVQEKLGKDEEYRLKAEGKIDELIEKRTRAILDRNSKQVEQLTAELEAAKKQASEFQTRFQRSKLDNAVAQKVTGLQDGSLDLAQQLARDLLFVDDEGRIEPKEDAPLWKEGKRVGIDTLKDFLLETRSFLFKPSAGGAASPTSAIGGMSADVLAKLPPTERLKLFRKQQAAKGH